ncbi:unnamed protein product, partial [Allacma fusca]
DVANNFIVNDAFGYPLGQIPVEVNE